MKYILTFGMLSLVVLAGSAHSAECSAVFPGAVQSYSASGRLTVNSDAQIIGSPSTILPFVNGTINANNGDSCETADCSVSGSPVESGTLAVYPSVSGGSSFTVPDNTVLGEGSYNTDTFGWLTAGVNTSFSSNYDEYFINGLSIDQNKSINLRPGTYWIESLNLNSDATLNIVSSGTVVLNVKSMNVNTDAAANGITANGVLNLNVYGNLNLNSNSSLSGIIYVTGTMTVNSGAVATGVIATKDLTLNSNGTVQYNSGILASADLGQLCSSSVAVDHYRVAFASQSYTCSATAVTVTACANASCSNTVDSTTSVTLATTSGSFASSSISFIGSGQDSLIKNDTGTAQLSVSSADPSAAFECSPSNCQTQFANGELSFAWASAPIISTVPQTAFADGIVVSNNTGGACNGDLEGDKLLLAVECDTPSSCNADQLRINNSLKVDSTTFHDTGLTFNSSGEATIPASYIRFDDAGQIRLLVQDENGLLQGASNTITMTPLLDFSAVTAATQIAGSNFNISIKGVGSAGEITPNYSPNQLQLLLTHSEPAGGIGTLGLSNTSVGGTSSVVSGSGYSNINNALVNITNGQSVNLQGYYSDVGEIEINVRDTGYFGYELNSSGAYAISRFIPAYFLVSDNSPILMNSCGNFSYSGQVMNFVSAPEVTLTAYNSLEQSVANYSGSSMKLVLDVGEPAAGDIIFSDNSGRNVSDIDITESEGTLTLDDDAAIFTLADASFTYPKDHSPFAPFTADVNIQYSANLLTDSDGVCYQPSYPTGCENYTIANIGGTELRYGRLVIDNTYGPETRPLFLSMSTQYFDSNNLWALNTDDSCTNFNAVDTEEISTTLATAAVFSESGTMVSGRPSSLQNSIQIAGPGEGNSGNINLRLNQPAHLFYDWDGNGTVEAPSATVTFGQYRGNDRIINWREVFN